MDGARSPEVNGREQAVDVDALTEETEWWFIRQGLPHFIADYTATEKVLPRAVPALVLAFLLSVFTTANPGWSLWRKGRFLVVSFLVLVVIWAGINRVRGLRPFRLPATVGPVEVALFVSIPSALDLLIRTPPVAGRTFVVKVVQLGVIYYATSYGLVPMAYWNFRRVAEHIDLVFHMIERTLPLLLLAVTFLFFNGPAWKTITVTVLPRYLALLFLFVGVTVLFLYQTVSSEVGYEELSTFDSVDEVTEYCAGSPVERIAASANELPAPPALSRREWANLRLMAMVSLWAYVAVGVLAVMLFFVLFGLLTIPTEAVTLLVGRPAEPVFTVTFFRSPLSLTRELMRIAGFLSVFAGLYLTVHGATDQVFRRELGGKVATDVRGALAVRAVYRAFLVPEREEEEEEERERKSP